MESIIFGILKELPEQDEKDFAGSNITAFLEQKYGKPKVISVSSEMIESVFEIEGKKIGVIKDTNKNITGYSIYRGAIPDFFIRKQPVPCANGYSRTFTVMTTSPTIPVSVITWLLGGGPLVAALATATLIAHTSNVSTAKQNACAPCALPCTCSAITVAGAGTAGATITATRLWGIPVGATASYTISSRITANCL